MRCFYSTWLLLLAAAAVALMGFFMPLDAISLLAADGDRGSRHSLYWHLQSATVTLVASHLNQHDGLSNLVVLVRSALPLVRATSSSSLP